MIRHPARNAWIPPADLSAIIDTARGRSVHIMRLALLTGYRIGDICASADSAWTGRDVTLTERKTGKKRTVPLTADARAEVEALRVQKMSIDACSQYLLPARRRIGGTVRGHVHRATVWRAWRRAIYRARMVGRGYTLHSLRKCYAVNLYQRTHSIAAVQAALLHDRPDTTLRYIMDYIDALAQSTRITEV